MQELKVIESLFDPLPDNMPPKGPAAKDKDIATVEEDVIQAVILAESFNKRFKPLTIDRPRASRTKLHHTRSAL